MRITGKGKQVGGTPLGRGALFHILRNPVYRGKIVHKGAVHQGEHPPIIDQDLFDKVQQHLAGKAKKRTQPQERPVECALLTGRIFDTTGEVMSPTFSRGRGGRIYRYYVSTSLQRGKGSKKDALHAMRRVPAAAIEHVLSTTLTRILPHMANPLDLLIATHIHRNSLALDLPRKLAAQIRVNLGEDEQIEDRASTHCTLTIPVHMPLRGGAHSVTTGQAASSAPDATLIAALRRAHSMTARDKAGFPLVAKAPISPYDRKILRLAFLCPQIQRDILGGRLPRSLNLQSLMQSDIPLDWAKQRQILGWSQHATKPVIPC